MQDKNDDYVGTFSEDEERVLNKYNELTNQEIIIPHIIEYVNSVFSDKREILSYLDIGCGNGSFTMKFLHALEKEGYGLQTTCLDYSEKMIEKFYLLNLNERRKIRLYSVKWDETTPKNKYKIITSFHSWYGITDYGQLRKLHDCLDSGGLGIIVLSDRNSYALKIQQLKYPELISSQEIMTALDELGIEYKYNSVCSYVSADHLISNGNLTDDALSITQFLQHETPSIEMQKKIYNIIAENRSLPIETHGIIVVRK